MTASDGTAVERLQPILSADDISVHFGGLKAVSRASFDVETRTLTALIGPNGAGKSTLVNVLTGFQQPTAGRVCFRGQDVTSVPAHRRVPMGMARTFQDVEVFGRLTVMENTLLGIQGQTGESLWRLVTRPLAARRQLDSNVARAMGILEMVGLAAHADDLAKNLSYGDQKLLILARLLATDAELLMLDEPGAGLPAAMIHRIGDLLRRMVDEHGKTVLLIDHNMNLVMNYAEQVVVLHHGQVIATGAPEQVKRDPEVVRVYLSR